MQYEISNRMSDVHGSAIRELFKLGADPNMISFGGGNPSAETFPVPEIADIIASGNSVAKFADRLEGYGAKVELAIALGKKISDGYDQK